MIQTTTEDFDGKYVLGRIIPLKDKHHSKIDLSELLKDIVKKHKSPTNKDTFIKEISKHIFKQKANVYYFNHERINNKEREYINDLFKNVEWKKSPPKTENKQKPVEGNRFDKLLNKHYEKNPIQHSDSEEEAPPPSAKVAPKKNDRFDVLLDKHYEKNSVIQDSDDDTPVEPPKKTPLQKSNNRFDNLLNRHYEKNPVTEDSDEEDPTPIKKISKVNPTHYVSPTMVAKFDKVRAIKSPDQREPEWYLMRNNKITASDGGTVLDMNPYEYQFQFIIKKVNIGSFTSNEFCYHGKKFEECATQVYEYKYNLSTDEFGLIGHYTYDFLGASPDRICNYYKYNKKDKSPHVGKMLEIKCPFVRKIKKFGNIKGDICPIYYWVQVQLQLECCDLEECDFWQCEIREYDSREEFISDSDNEKSFKSKTTGLEKSCLIELFPRYRAYKKEEYETVLYDETKFIYPPRIDMTQEELDSWIVSTISDLFHNEKYKDYILNRVIYWKLVDAHNVLITRDREWFNESLPTLQKVWNYVLHFREHKEDFDKLLKYVNTLNEQNNIHEIKNKTERKKINQSVMEYISTILKKIE